MNLPIKASIMMEIEATIEQLFWIEKEHDFLTNAFRHPRYIWKKATIFFLFDAPITKYIK